MPIRISFANSDSDSRGVLLEDHVGMHSPDVILVAESTISESGEVLDAIQAKCL